jgi:uncharacterized protein YwqG
MDPISPELRAELDAGIARRHLSAVADEIRKNATECYALVAIDDDDYSELGNTRFGGDPDLPDGWDWPIDPEADEPTFSNFIAQINFAELPQLSIGSGLPSRGILYLFVRFMEGAAFPVVLDSLYFDGPMDLLARRPSPDAESLCDEYLVDLIPQRIRAVPSVSLAMFQKQFRQHIETNTSEIDDEDWNFGENGISRLIDLESDLQREGQIGQLLGYANASEVSKNLYRQVALTSLGDRDLRYNDYWDTIQEYEAYIEEWRTSEHFEYYQGMRKGVEWLTSNRDRISGAVNQLRLLFRLDSNLQMNLNINDFDPLYVFITVPDLERRDFSNLAGEVTQN